MSRVTSRQPLRDGRAAARPPRPAVSAIPLSPEREPDLAETSIGELVREATTHLSTLVRSEVELARAEVTTEIRKGLKGSIFFVLALTVLIFSLFYAFFALGWLLDHWLPRSAAFAIVFVLMVLTAALFGFLGYLRVRAIRKPERTISSVKDTAQLAKRRGEAGAHTS